jgi:hypothetical protein
MNIEKLINQYESKIKLQDKEIESFTEEIRKIRRGENSYLEPNELGYERRIADAKRQAYVQFIEDLKEIEVKLNQL